MNNSLSEIFDTNKFYEYSGTYEAFKEVILNGTKADFLFLDKNKGAVLLNIVTDEKKFFSKTLSLQICKSHLYLPLIISNLLHALFFITKILKYQKKIKNIQTYLE